MTLLLFSNAAKEPTQTVAEMPKKITSLNIEKDEEEEIDETATTSTNKVKDPVPPFPPAFVQNVEKEIKECSLAG
ncbi:hypothetical protein PVK06_005161 [Gossypium arboreum]|uniref:Uncharacterized protein n=1 Tax=Gossypium arboreum TaxID=29729 RepID=A0ABR0QTW1_GOSAR|nr:hypothetical protein PVK06_005161 [Gossypium arboreum]